MTGDFFNLHQARVKELGTDDAQKLYDDVFLAKLLSKHGINFFKDTKENVVLLKEDGVWKIDLHRPDKLFRDVFAFTMWFNDQDEVIALAKRDERLKKMKYSDLVFREIASQVGGRRAKEVTLCAMAKTGNVSYGEVLEKYKREGSAKIINDCVKEHVYRY
jgi:hypothetical protein